MNIALKSYSESEGTSQGSWLNGSQAELEAIYEKAQKLHEFPKGSQRLERFYVDRPSTVEIFISDDAAKSIRSAAALRDQVEAKSRDRAKAELESGKNWNSANALFHKRAGERNAALGKVASLKEQQSLLPEKSLNEKISKAQGDYDIALKAFNEVLAQMNVLKNRKSTFDEKQAAYAVLGIIKISQPSPAAANTTTTNQ